MVPLFDSVWVCSMEELVCTLVMTSLYDFYEYMNELLALCVSRAQYAAAAAAAVNDLTAANSVAALAAAAFAFVAAVFVDGNCLMDAL